MPIHPSEAYQSNYANPTSPPAPNSRRPDPNVSPLHIILTTMRDRYALGDFDGAIALARIAAPYLHPKLPASTPPAELAAMTDADLDALERQV